VTAITGVKAVACGYGHTLALKTDGTVWAWGLNNSGQLGNGLKTNSTTPVQVSSMTGAKSIAAGANHSLALKNDGSVWAWGCNDNGQLGDNSTISRAIPTQVSGLNSGVSGVSGGVQHSAAVKNDGTVWAWGYNAYGQLGDGTVIQRLAPVQMSGVTGASAVLCGAWHSSILNSVGTVMATGDNSYGQFGDGSNNSSSYPVTSSWLSGITQLSAGAYHTLFVKGVVTCNMTMARTGNGTTTPATGTYPVASGVAQAITATPAAGNRFVNWTAAPAANVVFADTTAASTTATLTSDATVTAVFSNQVNLTMAVSGAGTTVPASGSTSSVTIGTATSITATPSTGWRFVSWGTSGPEGSITDPNSSGTTVTLTGNATITAYFLNTCTLTMAAVGSGTTSPAAGKSTVPYNVAQSITATPGAGYVFVGWSVTAGSAVVASPNSANTTVVLSTDATVTATFAQTCTLTMVASPGNAGTTSPAVGDRSAPIGLAQTIVATPAAGFKFTRWDCTSGAVISDKTSSSATVTLSASATVTAYFEAFSCTLTMAADPAGKGTTIPAVGPHTITGDTTLSISATAGTGYIFSTWTGSGGVTIASPTSSTTTVSLTGDAVVTAKFTALPLTLTMAVVGSGTTSPAAGTSQTVTVSDWTAISATAAAGYQFSTWSSNKSDSIFVNQLAPSTTVQIASDAIITANFSPASSTLTITVLGGGETSPTPGVRSVPNYTPYYIRAVSPSEGYGFLRWMESGGATVSNPHSDTTYVTMSANGAVAAVFVPVQNTLISFGNNNKGQLGDQSVTRKLTPSKVTGFGSVPEIFDPSVKTISGGGQHMLALSDQMSNPKQYPDVSELLYGNLYSWGSNSNGQLGYNLNGPFNKIGLYRTTPRLVSNSDFYSIVLNTAASAKYSMAVLGSGLGGSLGGLLYMWGDASKVNGTSKNTPSPVTVPGEASIICIAAASDHALCAGTYTYSMGQNTYGKLGINKTSSEVKENLAPINVLKSVDPKDFLGGASSLADGSNHCLALVSGSVWTWGDNSSGQLGRTPALGNDLYAQQTNPLLTQATMVAAGYNHSLAINNSVVYSWGDNSSGQLGDGTTTNHQSPMVMNLLTDIMRQRSAVSGVTVTARRVAAAGDHSLALLSDGSVWAWGANESGQLGDGTITTRTSPVQVLGLSKIVDIACGCTGTGLTRVSFSAASDSSGALFAWGNNYAGQLGDGTTVDHRTPSYVENFLSEVTFAAGGNSHSLGVKVTGELFAWGNNYDGQLGLNSEINQSAPRQTRLLDKAAGATGLIGAIRIAAGAFHSVAVSSSGTVGQGSVYTWGNNNNGQLGRISSTPGYPDLTSPVVTATDAAAGEYHTLALTTTGTVSSWGLNSSGQLGNGTTTNSFAPVQVTGLTGVRAIAAGYNHSLAIDSNNVMWAWGKNTKGQLGTGDTQQRTTPAQVNGGLTQIVELAAGENHSLALKADGTVYAWGYNYYGQLGTGNTTDSALPVKISALTNIIRIGAGANHSLAVSADGKAYTWGDNSYGQLGDGTTTSSPLPLEIISKSATGARGGAYHTLISKTQDASNCTLTVTVNVEGRGDIDPVAGPHPFYAGQMYWISASAYKGFRFSGWTIADAKTATFGDTSDASTWITMNAPTSITANFLSVTTSDFNGDGKSDILLKYGVTGELKGDFMDGGTPKETLSIFQQIGTSYLPIATGDFDGNGSTDILLRNVVPGSDGYGQIVMYLMDGANIVGSGVIFNGDTGWKVAGTGDFNGDYKTDILWRYQETSVSPAGHPADGTFALWLMSGLTIQQSGILSGITTGVNLKAGGVGDFNGDGHADILVWNAASGAATIYLMSGFNVLSTGSSPFPSPGGNNYLVAGVADFNGDSYADILWRGQDNGRLYMDLMHGDVTDPAILTRLSRVWLNIGDSVWLTVAGVGDFNGDGCADLLIRDQSSGSLTTYLMNGPSVVGGPALVYAGGDTNWIVPGLIDPSTSVLTMAVTPAGAGTTSPVIGVSNIQTVIPLSLVASANYGYIFNGWTVNAGNVYISSTTAASATAVVSGDTASITANFVFCPTVGADFNRDYHADLLWWNNASGDVALWEMTGSGYSSLWAGFIWRPGVSDKNWRIAGNSNIDPVSSPNVKYNCGGKGDFNGDGYTDIVWQNESTESAAMWLTKPAASGYTALTSAVIWTGSDKNWRIAGCGDFNGDSFCDLLWVNTSSGKVVIWLMNGTTTINSGVIFEGDAVWWPAAVGDFNGDGKADIAWRNTANGQVAVWLMNGLTPVAGGQAIIYDGSDKSWFVKAAGDLNGDGKSDLIWQHSGNGSCVGYIMNGASVTTWGFIYQGGDPNWTVVDSGDFNGDGFWDIAWRYKTDGRVILYMMNGLNMTSWALIYNGETTWFVVK
jgi:alpha-tubulin suppressor-like RCC1 family protein